MIKQKYKFKFFNDYVICSDLSVEDYLYLNFEPEKALKKIFWKKIALMNKRQIKNTISILLNPDETDLDKLFEKKEVSKWFDIEDFFIIEWAIMKNLNQQRSEIRSWEWKYFQKVSQNLDVIMWEKKYDDYKNPEKPDKKEIKKLLTNK